MSSVDRVGGPHLGNGAASIIKVPCRLLLMGQMPRRTDCPGEGDCESPLSIPHLPYSYVNYFSGLLSGSIRMNSSPLFLHHVFVPMLPAYEPGTGECCPIPWGGPLSSPLNSTLHVPAYFQVSSPSSRSTSPCNLSTHLESSECCAPTSVNPLCSSPLRPLSMEAIIKAPESGRVSAQLKGSCKAQPLNSHFQSSC